MRILSSIESKAGELRSGSEIETYLARTRNKERLPRPTNCSFPWHGEKRPLSRREETPDATDQSADVIYATRIQ